MNRLAILFALAACTTAHDASPDAQVPADTSATCASPTGLLHAQPLTVGSLDRHYMLYVPSSYACTSPMPLVIDFHGTWSGSEADNGEEFYALDGAIAAAESNGFILARPRSLSSVEDGESVYRWDENPGDLIVNATFARALVTHLEGLYAIDAARVYTLGFSSGTGMASQFLADQPQLFAGYAFVGGGYFPGEAPSAVHVSPATRMYGVSGYRDYLYTDEELLLALLDASSVPRTQYFQRTDMNGHELYGWHYLEMFAWLDKGNRPAAGTLATAWTPESVPTTGDLTALASDGAGGLIATGSTGGIFRRTANVWSQVAAIAGQPAFASVAVLPSGKGVAVGEAHVAHTIDHGATWTTDVTIPQFVPGFFTTPFLNAVAASAGELVTVGYWNAAHSADAVTWSATAAPLTDAPTLTAQGAQVKASAAGTWIATGYYDYLARSSDGITFTGVTPPVDIQWLMGIASAPGGHWWVSGEAGTILASSDDGLTWTTQTVATAEDLYAISFADALHGLAVGSHGAAFVTSDGGATWTARPTGLDAYLGDIAWLDATTALVIGGNGTAITTTVNR